MWAHLAGSGSWRQADTELCLTTTVLLGKKKRIWWNIIQNTLIMFMVFILTGKTAFLILRKRACLLYAAVPAGEPLEAHES